LTNWHNNQTLRLVEGKTIDMDPEKPPLYMTLTYKWADDATAAASTTSLTLSARLTTLSPSALPLLFLHAVEAAHKLNVPYLWVDSLCILQDSDTDFDAEAAMMSKIYRNSYCTISAGLDETNTLGLFRKQDVENEAMEFELRDRNGDLRKVRALKRQGWWEKMFEEGPLQQRGWWCVYPLPPHYDITNSNFTNSVALPVYKSANSRHASYTTRPLKSSGNAARTKPRKASQQRPSP
jgi:hypothetical protein